MRNAQLATVLGCLPAVLLAAPSVAGANWSSPGAGASYAQALSLDAPGTPAVARTGGGTDIRISWSTVTIGGSSASSYVIRRYDAANVQQTIGAACSGGVTGTSCVEAGVPAGIWHYKVQAHMGAWTGPSSSASAAIS
jgi:hypothetical protein